MSLAIQPIKKVELALLAGSKPGNFSLTPSPVNFEFIYGVSSSGLSPFEAAISNKHPREVISLSVAGKDAQEFFGNLFVSLSQALGLLLLPESLTVQIEVISVVEADNREVVKALAESLAHGGCSGSCGGDC